MFTVLDDDMKRVLREQRLGYVATVCPDGTPNLSPKGTTTVWDDQHLVFLDLHSPQTVGNIEAGNAVVEINVVDPIRRKGYRFKGSATVLRNGPLYDDVVRFYEQDRRTERGRIKAVVMVDVEQAAPLVSPAYDDGSTEDEIAERSLNMYGLSRTSTSER
jgi:predicted pyridoxine 5'-phosphate oxidase superfamily flavin-nucleotide-binding protein